MELKSSASISLFYKHDSAICNKKDKIDNSSDKKQRPFFFGLSKFDDCFAMAICNQILPWCSSSRSLVPGLKSLKPLDPLLVFAHSSLRAHSLRKKSRRLRVKATATLDSGNGAVVLEPPKKDYDSNSVTPYGRQFFPLAAVVGQVLNSFPHAFVCLSVCLCVMLGSNSLD